MQAFIAPGQVCNGPSITSLFITNVFGFLKSHPPTQGGVYGF